MKKLKQYIQKIRTMQEHLAMRREMFTTLLQDPSVMLYSKDADGNLYALHDCVTDEDYDDLANCQPNEE